MSTPVVDPCQPVVVAWVKDNAKKSITKAKASDIVHTATFFAEKHDLSTDTVLAVMKVESEFDSKAVSSEGAQGIMRVIPRWHGREIAGRSLFNHRVGIEVGAKILAEYAKLSDGNMKRAFTRYSGGDTSYWKRIDCAKKKLEEIKFSCESVDKDLFPI